MLVTCYFIADPLFWTGYVDKIGTGTEDIITLCKGKGLRVPEYHQEEDFRVVIWRKDDPNLIQNEALVERVYQEIFKDRTISRKKLSAVLQTSERQVRAAIEELRGKRIRRKSKTRGEWEIIDNAIDKE